jgi:YYY domain-containing protein
MVAVLARLSRIPTAYAYNLALGLWLALSFGAAYEIGRRLTGRVRYGLLAGLLLAICGNLDGALQALDGHVSDFNYFQSSRIIEHTINEFPYFSFIHADLHPHVLSIPLVLLVVYCLLQIVLRPALLTSGPRHALLARYAFLGVVLGALPCTNLADQPTFWGLAAITLATVGYRHGIGGHGRYASAFAGVGLTLLIVVLGRLLYFPFHQHFQPAQVRVGFDFDAWRLKGVGLVDRRTGLADFLIIHALFFYVLITDLLTRPGPLDPQRPWARREPVFMGLGSLGLLAFFVLDSLTPAVLIVMLAVLLMGWLRAPEPCAAQQHGANLLLFTALGLLLGCELFYIQDFYGGELKRHNTVFKFYYQAWMLLALASAYSLHALRLRFPGASARGLWAIGLLVLLASALVYPVLGTAARYFRDPPAGTLYGMDHLVQWHPDEHAAMQYLQQNAPRDARLLELPGDPYQYYGRYSANTGIPTLMGWIQHEAFWRDNTFRIPTARADEARRIYRAPALSDDIAALLDRHAVRYIVVGEVERREVPAEGLAKFERLPEAFRQGQVTIYLWEPRSD